MIGTLYPDRDKNLFESPTVFSQLPIRFPNGSLWDTFAGECAGCRATIATEDLRGRVSMPVPKTAEIEAIGFCVHCRLITRFHYRIHDDLRVMGLKDGTWFEWKKQPSLLDRLLDSIGLRRRK